jgi:hypothetical protein
MSHLVLHPASGIAAGVEVRLKGGDFGSTTG